MLLTANLQFQKNFPVSRESRQKITGKGETDTPVEVRLLRISGRGGYEKETVENEQESTIDITV